MEEVLFYRGKKILYNEDTHKDGIFFATDKGEILLNGVSYGSVNIDNELKATSLNPVTSAGIYAGVLKLILEALNSGNIPAKILIREEGNKQYRLYLLNKNGDEISSSDTIIYGEQSTDTVLGGTFFNINSDINQLIKKGNSAKFSCYYDRRDDEGYSTAVGAIIRVVKGDEIIKEFEVEANSNFTIEIPEKYASTESKTNFVLKATPVKDGTEFTEESKERSVSVIIIDFTLSLNGYQLANSYIAGDIINIPYIFNGYLGEKTVRIYVDGVREDSDGNILYPEQIVTEGGTFSISTKNWSEGTHNILIHAFYTTSDENVIYSNLIYIAVPIKGKAASFGCIFNLDTENPITLGQIPTLNVDLYKSFTFDFYASNLENSRVVEFYSEGSLISDYNVTTNTVSVNYKYNDFGTKLCKLYCGNQEFSFNVNVIRSDYTVFAPNNPALYLNALGKSNQSLSKDVWEYNGITSVFEGFNWDTDGWITSSEEPAIRLISGDKITINYKPLEYYDNASNAFTFMIKFKASSISDENQVLISCINEEGIGFEITGTEAYYKNSQGQTISTKFAPNETYNIAFTVFLKLDASTEYNKLRSLLMFLYVNGVMSGNALMADTASIYLGLNPTNIVIQAPSCTLDIFSIRYYKQACSETEMFSSYLVDLNNPTLLESEYISNQVLDSYGNVNLEKALKCGIPCVLVTGSFSNAGNNYNAVDYVAAMNDKDPKYDVEEILYLESEESSERNFLAIPKPSRIKDKDFPQLRLQGTSSMNYPIKNFRIYTKNSKMFLNVGINDLYKSISDIEQLESEGTYVAKSKPKFALRENSAPVNCWCLKADFAEASSSHNTGFAKLVHDLSMQLGSLTPPQKYKADSYKYDIRTTIDGYPCLLFSRETTSDNPVFRGKFNFNNDKSTEEVFGFVDIDGYHDDSDEMQKATNASMEWLMDSFEYLEETTDSEGNTGYVKKTMECAPIKELLGSNPVECWEFLNNEHPFGDFKNVNFNSYTTTYNKDYDFYERHYDWLNCWEARYPDEDDLNLAFAAGAVKPHYLETVALWIMSTDTLNATNNPITAVTYGNKTYTTDSVEYRKAKFSNELSLYFNVSFLCEYYVLNDMIAGADQRKKNMMWAFWYDKNISDDTTSPMGKVRCYPIYYDNDTILGVDNSGKITVPWNADENTITDTSYTFAGHDSVIWKNLRECMSSTLKATYRRIRAIADNDFIKSYFNQKLSDIYGEVIFNKDNIFKYLRSNIIGTAHKDGSNITPEFPWDSFADYVQGTRKAHRDWFINKRLDWFDNKNATSGFVTADLRFKGGIGYTPYYTFKTAKDAYYSITSDLISNIDTYHTLVLTSDNEYDYKFQLDQIPGPGATYRIYGLNNAVEFDLSHWAGFNSFIVGVVFSNLEKFVLGSIDYAPIRTADGISFSSNNYPLLKYLDVSNMLGSTAKPYVNADLSDLLYLETFIATGCSNLTTASFASGGNINKIVLPENFKNLYLVNLPKLTKESIQWGTCERPLWGITKDEKGNEIISKLEETEILNASYASVQLLHIENCPNLDAMDLLNTILRTENSNLLAIRIIGVNMSGDGSDLATLYKKGIKGLIISNDGSYNIDSKHCSITGTYKLNKLWVDEEQEITFEELCSYFNELDILQPEYTTISFDLANSTPQKVSNLDNNTGIKFGNTYSPSGHVAKILDLRHSYLVKSSDIAGEFNVMQLKDTDSNFYVDNNEASLSGLEGDYCMYEPHYWYKGINDHINRVMYVLFSSNKECPKSAKGIKLTTADCVEHKGKQANASNLITSESLILSTNTNYNVYEYIIPERHSYKQVRISGVSNDAVGSVIVDSNGQVLKRLAVDSNKSMYDGSYLFTSLPEAAYKIYLTLPANQKPEYCLYFTESEEIEAIEPDWVEHKECFVGRVVSALYDNKVQSCILTGASATGTDYYPETSSGLKVSDVCDAIKSRGKGYYAADYEVLKDIIILAYARYGGTDMHISYVGAGAKESGTFAFAHKFFPAGIDYTKYGIEDTKTTGVYDSYYTGVRANEFPEVATLMGYHQFIGTGSTTSYDDLVYYSTKTYQSSRTGRSVKIFADTILKLSLYILGGRYVDIFKNPANGTSSTGFCGEEKSGNTSGLGLLEFGFKGSRTNAPVTYSLNYTNNIDISTQISWSGLNRLQRILIIPDKINKYEDSNTFKLL